MNKCKNCEMTDEYCASGDCPNDKTLNEQWCEGTLPRDKYYYAKDCGKDCIVQIDKSNDLFFSGWEVPYHPDQSDKLEPFKLSTELLAQVPSYNEWEQLQNWARFTDDYHVLKEKLEIAEYDNAQLKELLKECRQMLFDLTPEYSLITTLNVSKFIKKINEVLNE